MRKFEMYLVFFMSTASLSFHNENEFQKFKTDLLEKYNEERTSQKLPKLELVDAEENLRKFIRNSVKDNLDIPVPFYLDSGICFYYDIIPNLREITAQKAFDTLKMTHYQGINDVSRKWDEYIRQNASAVAFMAFDMENNKKEIKECLVVIYYPKDHPNATFDNMQTKFNKINNIVETNSDLFTKIELPDVDQK